jgi:hypothetical protein
VEKEVTLRSAILGLFVLLGSQPAVASVELHPITRNSFSGLWEGIEPLGLSVFLVEIDGAHGHRAVVVREDRTLVFRLDEPKVDTKGQVSLTGREVTRKSMTIRITGSGDATEASGFLKARVAMGLDPKKDPDLARLLPEEVVDIPFLKPGGVSGLRLQRLEDRAQSLLSKEQKESSR